MSRLVSAVWSPDPGDVSGLPRRYRRPCRYDAYVPDPLVGREVLLPADVAADVSDAERAVLQLNASGLPYRGCEAIARLLLRAEAVASSRIEGLEIGGRRLTRADAARAADGSVHDAGAAEVLGNIDAMRAAVDDVARRPRLDLGAISEIHRALLAGTRDASWAGTFRDRQNWIGGSSYNPCAADFVPPPPDEVPALLTDLVEYLESDLHPPVVQAALAHAQFETIHPFADGNGRTGRALIHVVLTRRGLSPHHVPPVSLVLATRSQAYIAGLESFRTEGHDGPARWIAIFAAATTEACERVSGLTDGLAALQGRWREAIGTVRGGSTAAQLLDEVLPQTPVFTVGQLVTLTGRSTQAVNEAVDRLQSAGVLRQTTAGRRNRAFEVDGLIDLITGFERSLASPAGDTAVEPPARPVPRRLGR
ncbi:Fic family protein [Kineococcus sp. R8]|uniref:Fic family protein n=1 Tax=Kineococcus siccus TaxID=2696567 RepID=UPI001412C568|nr:Fic family protein [Kineococcus siccus]NAZ80268.1 Fic family protein [Kineococcus siccus]